MSWMRRRRAILRRLGLVPTPRVTPRRRNPYRRRGGRTRTHAHEEASTGRTSDDWLFLAAASAWSAPPPVHHHGA